MGIEGFVYPLLVLVSALVSAMLAWALNRNLGARYRLLQLLLVAVAAPLMALALAVGNAEVVWVCARFSIRLTVITSCTIAVLYTLIKRSK